MSGGEPVAGAAVTGVRNTGRRPAVRSVGPWTAGVEAPHRRARRRTSEGCPMATMYCALCKRPVEARRHIGAGSVILALASIGFSVLAIPFYKKRCSICRSAAVSVAAPEGLGAGAAATSAAIARTTALEQRLGLAEGDLEATVAELERVRTERDFYRQLLGDRAPSEPGRPREV